jgi:alpha-N-arabinofuranosidase
MFMRESADADQRSFSRPMNIIRLSRQITKCAAVLALVALSHAGAVRAQDIRANTPVVLKIETDRAIGKVSPTLYGLMTEEINYSYDGGIFAELIRNRTFRNSWMGAEHWQLVQRGNAKAAIQEDRTTGPSAALNYSLKLSV